jgi:hypothetical protein
MHVNEEEFVKKKWSHLEENADKGLNYKKKLVYNFPQKIRLIKGGRGGSGGTFL